MVLRESNEYRTDIAPVVELDKRTLVYDRSRKRQVLWIQGAVILPVGATVELIAPHVSAEVVGVRLLIADTSQPAQVCLDVDVPEEYWTTTESTEIETGETTLEEDDEATEL